VDSADLPLNMSREMIQDSPVLAAIQKGVTNRILSELDKLSSNDADKYAAIWDNFGPVLKEGLYEDFERREQLLGLARFKSTTAGDSWRSLKDYVAGLKDNQTAIYYATGSDIERLAQSPQLEGFRARGIEVLLLPDQVDSFWTTIGVDYEGKPFKSVTQGAADLSLIPLAEGEAASRAVNDETFDAFIAYAKDVLADQISDVRASDRLTTSAVCVVAPDNAMDIQLEKMLAAAGRAPERAKPVLEVNPGHALIAKLAEAADGDDRRDIAFLLLDEARIAEGEQPTDPRAFAERLERLMTRALG
jgi:molecular chaperone HtpG